MHSRWGRSRVRATGPWARWWRGWYRSLRLVEAPLAWLTRRRGFGNLVMVQVVGRRSGQLRELPLGLLTVDGARYLGHPSGDCGWTLNLRAAGWATIERAGRPRARVTAVALEGGPERDAVIRASFQQHPFPGNLLYRLARRHVQASGVFFRLSTDGAQVGSTRLPPVAP